MIMSILILCLALIVGVVGVTAAWFGDVNSVSRVITVSSAQPAGSATMEFNTGYSGQFPNDTRMRPAVLHAGLAIGDTDGSEQYDTLDLPYTLGATTYNADGSTYTTGIIGTVLDSAAVAVQNSFRVKFAGSGTTKNLRVEITSATLDNPREQIYGAATDDISDDVYVLHKNLADYKTEFISVITVTPVDPTKPATSLVASTHALNFTVVPRYEYTVTATVYFKYADEFTSTDLIDTQVFFNFELYTLS